MGCCNRKEEGQGGSGKSGGARHTWGGRVKPQEFYSKETFFCIGQVGQGGQECQQYRGHQGHAVGT